eukprot:CAMPEP_0172436362 /NCGR_PEP_ID=MMETSP1064-20121228/71683_1 /TAXON_ID=202472 /ORGANISM="Aulacoseira subarctica , Strain CCAP 1002/5" /LENGTH=1257 /DNA_ID=CAMNT_0013184763 /DNA_START=30 /DNA_END=3802 /DNA_ORIENTATION=-
MDNSTDKWRFCPLCSQPFTSAPDTTVDDVVVPDSDDDEVRNLVIPVPSVACSHLLCLSCLQQHQQTINDDAGNLTAGTFVPCPICSEEDAFLIKNCKTSSVLCDLLKTVQEQSLQNQDLSLQLQEQSLQNQDLSLQNQEQSLQIQEQSIQIIELQDILKTVQESKFEERKDGCENFALDELEEEFVKLDEAKETISGQDKREEGTLLLTENGINQEQSLQIQEQSIQIIELQDILKTVQESKFEDRKDGCENFASDELEEEFVTLDETKETIARQDKREEGTLLLTENGNQGVQQPTVSIANGTNQPGAYPIPGLQLNSNNINDGLQSDLAEISNDNIIHAYVVEPTPTPVLAFAEPLVSFFEKYRWPLRGLVVAAIVATIVALAIKIPTVRRTKSLTLIALGVSNQTSLDLLGGPQKMAFNWILGRNNAKFDPSKNQAQIKQRYILATLFFSTGGFDWNQTGNMLSSDGECAWLEQAINCKDDGSVAIIQLGKLSIDMYCVTLLLLTSLLSQLILLESNNLHGSLPSEVGYLEQLQVFAIGSNNVSGALFSELGFLNNLRVLNVSNNQMLGEIPQSFGDLTSLHLLDLSSNNLDRAIPTTLGNLANLRWLKLSGNKLSSGVPTELGSLQNLIELRLGSNILSGSIPTEICLLLQLTHLDMSENALTGILPSQIPALRHLQWVDLHSNDINDAIPNFFSYLKELTYLDLSFNRFFNQLIGLTNGVSPPKKLAELRLNDNQLTSTIPRDFGQFTQLRNLALDNNKIEGTIPTEIGNLAELQSLDISMNILSGTIPSTLGNVTGLGVLNLENNLLFGTIPCELGYLTQLQSLKLTNNNLYGSIPNELGNITHLQELWLHNNQLNGTIPTELGLLTELIFLGFESNNITGTIPRELANLTYLQFLWFSLNQVSGTIPNEIASLSELVLFAVDFNDLTGTIPKELGNLTNLYLLQLSQNNLSGTIPTELGKLTGLQELHLEHTLLSGTIPTEISNLSQLRCFSTSTIAFAGKLNGTIPTELGKLTSLNELKMENNAFTGTLPTELGNLIQLQTMQFLNNLISGTIPREYGNLTSLATFLSFHNSISGPIPTEIGKLNQVRFIELQNNLLTGTIPGEVGNLMNLEEFNVSSNMLTGPVPSAVERMAFNSSNFKLNLQDNFNLFGDFSYACQNRTNLQNINVNNTNISCSCCGDVACVSDPLNCGCGQQTEYRGTIATTVSGKTCQAWSSQSPQIHDRTPANFPNAGLESNFCRNPDGEERAW